MDKDTLRKKEHMQQELNLLKKEQETKNIFKLESAEKPCLLTTSYTIKKATIDRLTTYAKIKNISRNKFIVELIKIGIDEELYKINPKMNIELVIGKPKKISLGLKIPAEYDVVLEQHRQNLENSFNGEIKFSKSQILDLLFDLLLKRFK